MFIRNYGNAESHLGKPALHSEKDIKKRFESFYAYMGLHGNRIVANGAVDTDQLLTNESCQADVLLQFQYNEYTARIKFGEDRIRRGDPIA